MSCTCTSKVDHWLEFSARRLCGQAGLTEALVELDKALSLRTFLVGHVITLADISVWAALKGEYIYIFTQDFSLSQSKKHYLSYIRKHAFNYWITYQKTIFYQNVFLYF